MANVDNPHGLRPLGRTIDGGCPQVLEFGKAAATAAIYQWDVVSRLDTSFLTPGGTPGTTPYLGVSLNYGNTGAITKHLVSVSKDALYEAQDNNDTDGFVEADMGLNANLEFTTGNTVTLISKQEIDESTLNTTDSLDVHLLRKFNAPDNAYGAWVRVEILFNKHRLGLGVAGV